MRVLNGFNLTLENVASLVHAHETVFSYVVRCSVSRLYGATLRLHCSGLMPLTCIGVCCPWLAGWLHHISGMLDGTLMKNHGCYCASNHSHPNYIGDAPLRLLSGLIGKKGHRAPTKKTRLDRVKSYWQNWYFSFLKMSFIRSWGSNWLEKKLTYVYHDVIITNYLGCLRLNSDSKLLLKEE